MASRLHWRNDASCWSAAVMGRNERRSRSSEELLEEAWRSVAEAVESRPVDASSPPAADGAAPDVTEEAQLEARSSQPALVRPSDRAGRLSGSTPLRSTGASGSPAEPLRPSGEAQRGRGWRVVGWVLLVAVLAWWSLTLIALSDLDVDQEAGNVILGSIFITLLPAAGAVFAFTRRRR